MDVHRVKNREFDVGFEISAVTYILLRFIRTNEASVIKWSIIY